MSALAYIEHYQSFPSSLLAPAFFPWVLFVPAFRKPPVPLSNIVAHNAASLPLGSGQTPPFVVLLGGVATLSQHVLCSAGSFEGLAPFW